MDAITCIKTRQSIRAFLKKTVPEDLLKEIVEIASWSPSYKNTQPWEVMIVSGKKKEELSEMLVGLLEKGEEPTPDIPEPVSWPGPQEGRIRQLIEMRKKATGIDISDPEIIKKAKKANFRFYGAPHGIFLYQDKDLPLWSLFDLGLFAQSLMLAAHAKGLGTVPQAFLTDYARQTKEFLGIPDSKRLVLGISIGYPDMDAPPNKIRTDRVGLDEILIKIQC